MLMQNKLTILIWPHVDTQLQQLTLITNVTLHHCDPRHNHRSDCEVNTHTHTEIRLKEMFGDET